MSVHVNLVTRQGVVSNDILGEGYTTIKEAAHELCKGGWDCEEGDSLLDFIWLFVVGNVIVATGVYEPVEGQEYPDLLVATTGGTVLHFKAVDYGY